LRVITEEEINGLDLSQHGEEGYELGMEIIAAPRASERAHLASHATNAAPAHNLSE